MAHPELPVWRNEYYADCDCPPEQRIGGQEQQRRQVELLDGISQTARRDMTFESFDVMWPAGQSERKNLLDVAGLARAFACDPARFTWSVTLYGSFGCGKTHLGRAMQNLRQEDGSGAAFVVVPDLLDYIRSTFGGTAAESYDQSFERVRNAPFLILDDLGREYATDWVDEKLFQIINHRYDNLLPTVVLTNVRLDDLEERIASRLHEGIVHVITAGDYRRRNRG